MKIQCKKRKTTESFKCPIRSVDFFAYWLLWGNMNKNNSY